MKNQLSTEFAELMVKAAAEFTARKKGQEWRAIVFTLSDVFAEDRVEIRSIAAGASQVKEPTVGKAKVIRPGTRHKSDVRPQAKASRAVRSSGGCSDCPDEFVPTGVPVPPARSNVLSTIDGKKVRKPSSLGTIGGGKKEPIAGLAEPFADVDDVMTRFKSDAKLMKAFCQAKQIKVGNASKPLTLAGYIYDAQTSEEE